jgi:hypothetical protein
MLDGYIFEEESEQAPPRSQCFINGSYPEPEPHKIMRVPANAGHVAKTCVMCAPKPVDVFQVHIAQIC